MASPFLDDNVGVSLLFESERLKTFFEAREGGSIKLWSSVADITPEELAKDGFYFLKKDDHCACVFCRGIVGVWEKGDMVRSEHQKHFPRCPFIRGEPVGNIPMPLCEHLEPLWRETIIKRLKERKIPRIIYSEFSPPGNREASFASMTFSVNMKKKLSAAGFYNFADISDHVRCFRCGLGLRGWSESMDPLKMHAKYSPNCMVVKLGHSAAHHGSKKKKLNDTLVDLVIEHGDIERHMMIIGFPPDAIKAAVRKRLLEEGITFHRVGECAEAILNVMEARAAGGTRSSESEDVVGEGEEADETTIAEQGITSHRAGAETIMEARMAGETRSSESESVVGEGEEADETTIAEMSQEEAHMKRNVTLEFACKVCLCEEAVVVLFPCKHLCVCSSCAISFEKCPVCRTNIDHALKIIRC